MDYRLGHQPELCNDSSSSYTDKQSTDKIKHDMIKKRKKKQNKDVALPLACIIFTVKTMILTCKEEYSSLYKTKYKQQICYIACVNVYMISFFSPCNLYELSHFC